MTSFMQPQMTDQQWWWCFDSPDEGTTWVPYEYFTRDQMHDEFSAIAGTLYLTAGYGVRRSAPGYMDCTEWEVFGDEADAQAAFDEMIIEDKEMYSDD